MGENSFIEGDKPALVKPMNYDLSFIGWRTGIMFGRAPKLILWFRILNEGEYTGVHLPRYYNVKRLVGRPQQQGEFRIGWQSAFVREYARLFGIPQRLDRIAMSRFSKHIIEGRVGTVKRDVKQNAIPESLHYSVIAELKKVKQL